MAAVEQLQRLLTSIAALGGRRLTALGIAGLAVAGLVVFAGSYLSRPEQQILYNGLEPQDVSRIGAALREAGIEFDISPEGDAVLVRYGQTAKARMFLAEKGLPDSVDSGYELFDNMGSIGLTSFMQEVTRVRALEGEIARTIQTMKGVKAARVHLVLTSEGSFRRRRVQPSASVVVRSESGGDYSSGQAIRHLVAAAVPGMSIDNVTVLDSNGTILASGEDSVMAAPGKMMGLETAVSTLIQNNVRKTLAPYLGLDDFQISVTAKLNADKRQINETIFDPDSRVERSVRVIKETGTAQNVTAGSVTSVEQNLPEESSGADGAGQSSEENERREELTNYELNSKTIATVSEGYAIDHISVAVVVNRGRLTEILGDKATPETIAAQVSEIEKLVASASGLDTERGDKMTVSAVEFLAKDESMGPVPPPGLSDFVVRQSGILINAVTVLVVTILFIWLGLRPAIRSIVSGRTGAPDNQALLESARTRTGDSGGGASSDASDPNLIEDLTDKMRHSPQKRLAQILDYDEEQAIAIMKHWLREA